MSVTATHSPVTLNEALARIEGFAHLQLDTPPSSTSEPVAYGFHEGVRYVAEGLIETLAAIRAEHAGSPLGAIDGAGDLACWVASEADFDLRAGEATEDGWLPVSSVADDVQTEARETGWNCEGRVKVGRRTVLVFGR